MSTYMHPLDPLFYIGYAFVIAAGAVLASVAVAFLVWGVALLVVAFQFLVVAFQFVVVLVAPCYYLVFGKEETPTDVADQTATTTRDDDVDKQE